MRSDEDAPPVRILTEAGVRDVSYSWRCEQYGDHGTWTNDRETAEAEARLHRCA